MSDIVYVGSAVHAALSAGTLTFYRDLAPGTAEPPFGVWSIQGGNDEYEFTGKLTDFDFNVRVITDDEWSTTAENLYQNVETLLQDAGLSITGHDALQCRRRSPIHFRDPDGFWNVGGLFRVWVHDQN